MPILSFLYLRPMYIEELHCTIQVFKRHLLSIPSQQHQSQLHTMNHVIQMYIKKLKCTKQLFKRHLPSVSFQQKQSQLFTLSPRYRNILNKKLNFMDPIPKTITPYIQKNLKLESRTTIKVETWT